MLKRRQAGNTAASASRGSRHLPTMLLSAKGAPQRLNGTCRHKADHKRHKHRNQNKVGWMGIGASAELGGRSSAWCLTTPGHLPHLRHLRHHRNAQGRRHRVTNNIRSQMAIALYVRQGTSRCPAAAKNNIKPCRSCCYTTPHTPSGLETARGGEARAQHNGRRVRPLFVRSAMPVKPSLLQLTRFLMLKLLICLFARASR